MAGPFGGIVAGTLILGFVAQWVAIASIALASVTGIGGRPAVTIVLVGVAVAAYGVLRKRKSAQAEVSAQRA